MASWWGSRATPLRVQTDKIVPLGYFDDTLVNKSYTCYNLLVFEDRLDPKKLCDSLGRLVRRSGWEKLGARLRTNSQGGLEYHIPEQFSEDRPAMGFTQVHYETTAESHGIRVPKATSRPALVGDPDQFTKLVRAPGVPTTLDDYLNTDRPQLGIHIVCYQDLTVVVTHFPHTLMDGTALGMVSHAWALVLHGKEDDILAPVDWTSDPLSELGKHPSSAAPLVLKNQVMSTPGMAVWGLREKLHNTFSTKEGRIYCVPKSYLKKLRGAILLELAAEAQLQGREDEFDREWKPSDHDVLAAWFTRLAVSYYPRASTRMVAIQSATSWRNVLEGELLPPDRPYISNAIGVLAAMLPVRDILQMPLSYVAMQIRHAFLEQGTRDQAEAYCAAMRHSRYKLPPLYGDSSTHYFVFSNLAKAKFYELDFSPAASGARDTPCRPSYTFNTLNPPTLDDGYIVNKDIDGNYWISGYRAKRLWAKM